MSKGFPRAIANNPQVAQTRAIPVKDLPLLVTATGAGVGFGSAVAGGLPQGNVLILGATSYLSFSTEDDDVVDAAFPSTYGIGTTVDANGAIAGTEEDIIAEVTNGAATAKVTPVVRGVGAGLMVDNTAADVDLNINFALTDEADITDGTTAPFLVNGTIYLAYLVLGDD
jgi:hypothetical protein